MSEPTKEQIEEMYAALQIAVGEDWVVRPGAKDYMLTPAEILRLIAHVRKKARDDALEAARDIVDCVRFTTTAPEYEGEMVEQAAQEMMRQIVELKDQPSGEQL